MTTIPTTSNNIQRLPTTSNDFQRLPTTSNNLQLHPTTSNNNFKPIFMAFTLPALPYSFDALEPHIDAQTMQIHHDKHHQAYVANLNKALAGTEGEGKSLEDLMANISSYPAAVRNNGGGHFNHSLFWQVLGPNGGQPEGALADAINSAFGSLDGLKEKMNT